MQAALVQLNSSDDPARNLPVTLGLLEQAADRGAELIVTPEVTNCVSLSRSHQADVLQVEADDITLAACRAFAKDRGVWLLLGSLALTGGADGRFVNRAFLITGDGAVAANAIQLAVQSRGGQDSIADLGPIGGIMYRFQIF